MKLSRRWIADYVELPESVEELARRLTGAGLAVEGIEAIGSDVVLDIDVTTNRPDCMNHYGVAREIAAILDRPLQTLPEAVAGSDEAASAAIRLMVEDAELCPRYTALVVRGVQVGPSPDWLVERLQAIGHRSINNVVDVTNYVLWETGQPLHAFDLDRLTGAEIRVRLARAGETLLTLDGQSRKLEPDHLVIADAEKPIGLAGVMGGLESEVTADTVDVLLESAHFSPLAVRRTAKKLGMHTDASHRFERGADPEACLRVARRAAGLIVEVAGGRLLTGSVEHWQPKTSWPPRLEIQHSALCRFGGVDLGRDEVERIFRALGFGVESLGGVEGIAEGYRLQAPSWRYYDFQNPYPQDFYEEVLRIHGFDGIAATLPAIGGADAPASPTHLRRRASQDLMAACGYAEAITFAFLDRASDAKFPSLVAECPPLPLANALSDRYAVMRRSLLPNLAAAATFNLRRGQPAVRLFEIGHVFWQPEEGTNAEMDALAVVLGGQSGTPWERALPFDFYDLKGVLEALLDALGIEATWHAAALHGLIEGTGAELRVDGRKVGFAGQLDEEEPGLPLFIAEVGLELLPATARTLLVVPPSRFPGISVDATLTHALSTPWSALAEAIAAEGVPDLVRFGLKDRYRGQGVPEGAVNTTLFFDYNSDASSLTQETVNERQLALAARLEQRFGWKQEKH
jgi:phenylalanyl-tRNA synthetase beta chain